MSGLILEAAKTGVEEAALIALEEGGEIEGSGLLKKTQNLGSRVLNSQAFQFSTGGAVGDVLYHKGEKFIDNYVIEPVKKLTGFEANPDNVYFPSNSVTITKTGTYDGENTFDKPMPENSVVLGANPDIPDMYHNQPAPTTFAQDASRF